jgi:hypothetical protein
MNYSNCFGFFMLRVRGLPPTQLGVPFEAALQRLALSGVRPPSIQNDRALPQPHEEIPILRSTTISVWSTFECRRNTMDLLPAGWPLEGRTVIVSLGLSTDRDRSLLGSASGLPGMSRLNAYHGRFPTALSRKAWDRASPSLLDPRTICLVGCTACSRIRLGTGARSANGRPSRTPSPAAPPGE